MKKIGIVWVLSLTMFILLATPSHAGSEIGEFCWSGAVSVGEKNLTGTLSLQVTEHGRYYSFNGKVTLLINGTLWGITPLFGSGYIEDNQMHIGLAVVAWFEDPPDLEADGISGAEVTINLLSGLDGTAFFTSRDSELCVAPCDILMPLTLIPCP